MINYIIMAQNLQLQNPPVKLQADLAVDMEVSPQDLELLEARVAEIERYLGIQDMDLAYFLEEEGEDLKSKSTVLDDFMRAAGDKCFCIKDLVSKFQKMEYLLKSRLHFQDCCLDLKRKSDFVVDQVDTL